VPHTRTQARKKIIELGNIHERRQRIPKCSFDFWEEEIPVLEVHPERRNKKRKKGKGRRANY
jgi:hypothetical protein